MNRRWWRAEEARQAHPARLGTFVAALGLLAYGVGGVRIGAEAEGWTSAVLLIRGVTLLGLATRDVGRLARRLRDHRA